MGEHGSVKPYITIYFWLLGLFVISVLGPEIADMFFSTEDGTKTTFGTILVLTTAFGIAFVKAYLVAAKFMHLDVEKPVVWYLLTTCTVFMVLLFAAIAPDIQNHSGDKWENVAAKAAVIRGIEKGKAGHHGDGHGDDHHGDDHHGDDHGADAKHKDDHHGDDAHKKEGEAH